jgi:cytochrome c biogenesis protein ResB
MFAIGLMVLLVVSLVVSMLPPPAVPQSGAVSAEVFLSPDQAMQAASQLIADVAISPAAEQYFVNDVLAYKIIIGDVATSTEAFFVDARTGVYLQTTAATITLAPGRIDCQTGACLYTMP